MSGEKTKLQIEIDEIRLGITQEFDRWNKKDLVGDAKFTEDVLAPIKNSVKEAATDIEKMLTAANSIIFDTDNNYLPWVTLNEYAAINIQYEYTAASATFLEERKTSRNFFLTTPESEMTQILKRALAIDTDGAKPIEKHYEKEVLEYFDSMVTLFKDKLGELMNIAFRIHSLLTPKPICPIYLLTSFQ